MKRIADPKQRHLRWSMGCAHLELVGGQLTRPGYLLNRFAPRGSAAV